MSSEKLGYKPSAARRKDANCSKGKQTKRCWLRNSTNFANVNCMVSLGSERILFKYELVKIVGAVWIKS